MSTVSSLSSYSEPAQTRHSNQESSSFSSAVRVQDVVMMYAMQNARTFLERSNASGAQHLTTEEVISEFSKPSSSFSPSSSATSSSIQSISSETLTHLPQAASSSFRSTFTPTSSSKLLDPTLSTQGCGSGQINLPSLPSSSSLSSTASSSIASVPSTDKNSLQLQLPLVLIKEKEPIVTPPTMKCSATASSYSSNSIDKFITLCSVINYHRPNSFDEAINFSTESLIVLDQFPKALQKIAQIKDDYARDKCLRCISILYATYHYLEFAKQVAGQFINNRTIREDALDTIKCRFEN